ncbi:JAB domain-containing protein [Clostridiaceae bacterium M8S5]|nr:JAB domain-containing protein [Clostridiaceae bacterium M8S5]
MMYKPMNHKVDFFRSLKKLTGIPINKMVDYAEKNEILNILQHPSVVNPTKAQLGRLEAINEFISAYKLLSIKQEDNRIKLDTARVAGEYFTALLSHMRNKERVIVAYLDSKNFIIETKVLSVGTINCAYIHPKEILKQALANDCTSFILAHNHPSGETKVSREDIEISQRLVDVFKPIGISFLDHIVVGGNKFTSMLSDKILPKSTLKLASYDPIPINVHRIKDEQEWSEKEEFKEDDDELEL